MEVKHQLDGKQLERIIKTGVTLVDFNAPWCAPCRAQAPVIKALAKKFNNAARIIDMNVDENREFAIGRGIASIPTLILFKDGHELRRFVGLQPTEVLSRAIEDALS